MEQNSDISNTIINTINIIFEKFFSSIDTNLYKILDELIFIDKDILKDNYFEEIIGLSSQNGILLIANSLIIGFLIYYATKFLISNFTYEKIENPSQFIFKCIIFAICMNSTFFIVEQVIRINYNICELIRNIGNDLFNKDISFAGLINEINCNSSIDNEALDIFTLDGLIKGTITISLLNLVFSYSLRYVMLKILILLAPFAILSLSLENTAHFLKSWYKSFFSLLFIQIIVSVILVLLFSMDYSDGKIINKFIYMGGIYALLRANSIVRELFGGISTNIQTGITKLNIK